MENFSSNDLSSMDPLVRDFLMEILELTKTNKNIELSGDINSSGSCWWCASSLENFESYDGKGNAQSLMQAEKEESVERKKSSDEKHITPFYLIEVKLVIGATHFYRVIGIDTTDKTMFTQDIGGLQTMIEKIFDDVMKVNYPIKRTTRKYGL